MAATHSHPCTELASPGVAVPHLYMCLVSATTGYCDPTSMSIHNNTTLLYTLEAIAQFTTENSVHKLYTLACDLLQLTTS